MESKVCVICKTEKSIENFYKNYRECKPCNIQRSIKRYYENKDKLPTRRKLYYKKKVLLAKSKLNQQSRNCERKIYEQQIEELNKKLEDLTQAIKMLKTPNS